MADLLFGAGVRLRHILYDLKWFKSARVEGARVVSVGNIACGGVGKTPFVKLVARRLVVHKKVAIVTRGYRSKAEKYPGGLVVRADRLVDPSECGDEPYLLAKALPEVTVYVGWDRVASTRQAVTDGHEVILLDDGMQHRRLVRDVECVVLDGHDLFAGGRFLPRGRLRETPKRLAGADLLVVNHVQDEAHFEQICGELRSLSKAPVVGMGYAVREQVREKVGVFCALGTPMRFVSSVRDAGLEVVATQFALDHRPFDLKELHAFAKRCESLGAAKLVCTEKDAVKLATLDGLVLPVEVIEGELEVRFGKENFETFLSECVT